MGEPTAIRLEAAKLRCQQRDIGWHIIKKKTPPICIFIGALEKDVLDFSLKPTSEAGDPGGFMAIDGRCR